MRGVCACYLKAMMLPGVSFWKVISCTNSERPFDVTPAFFITVLSSSCAHSRTSLTRPSARTLKHTVLNAVSAHRDVLFHFYCVFWHAVDVVLILLIFPGAPFHHPCLQHHLLYFPWEREKVAACIVR